MILIIKQFIKNVKINIQIFLLCCYYHGELIILLSSFFKFLILELFTLIIQPDTYLIILHPDHIHISTRHH